MNSRILRQTKQMTLESKSNVISSLSSYKSMETKYLEERQKVEDLGRSYEELKENKDLIYETHFKT